jgi:glycosyltransferase involved in cell wall biosynthesis
MFSLALILWRLRRRTVSAVFCNAMPHYVLALLVLRIATINCVLNLEDGIRADMKDFRSRVGKVLVGVWDRLSVAAMVANSRLVEQIKTRPAYCFYGVAREMEIVRSWDLPLQVLFSGNLSEGTGARNLLDGLLILTREYPDVASRFHFVVTGSGDLAREVETLAGGLLSQHIEFRGVVSDGEYQDLLRTSHIGLCLKMPDYSMGQTTFPSKTVEFAIWGLLVVTHRVSDVPLLFPDDGAFLLDEATPEALTQVLRQIASAPRDAQIRADRGRQAIGIRLRPQVVATDLARLWQSPPHPLRRKRGEDVSRA